MALQRALTDAWDICGKKKKKEVGGPNPSCTIEEHDNVYMNMIKVPLIGKYMSSHILCGVNVENRRVFF